MSVPESTPASWEGWSNCPASRRPKFDPAGVYDFGKPLVSMRLENMSRRGVAVTGSPVDRATPPSKTDLCPASFYQCGGNVIGYEGKGGDHSDWVPPPPRG